MSISLIGSSLNRAIDSKEKNNFIQYQSELAQHNIYNELNTIKN